MKFNAINIQFCSKSYLLHLVTLFAAAHAAALASLLPRTGLPAKPKAENPPSAVPPMPEPKPPTPEPKPLPLAPAAPSAEAPAPLIPPGPVPAAAPAPAAPAPAGGGGSPGHVPSALRHVPSEHLAALLGHGPHEPLERGKPSGQGVVLPAQMPLTGSGQGAPVPGHSGRPPGAIFPGQGVPITAQVLSGHCVVPGGHTAHEGSVPGHLLAPLPGVGVHVGQSPALLLAFCGLAAGFM